MYPEPGSVGPLKLVMYRGIKLASQWQHESFASDPGDYGCGEYWTDTLSFAEGYGEVISKEIILERVYHIPTEELRSIISEYRTCRMEDGKDMRRANSLRLTKFFESKGYQAVLTEGYESFTVKGLCIFAE